MQTERDIIVIGSSAGGTDALVSLMKHLPQNIPAAIFVAQHSDKSVDKTYLPKILKNAGFENCKVAEDGELIQYGWIYCTPPDHHLLLQKGKILVIRGPRENGYRPSIDMLFRSAAAAYDSQVIGIVLSGMLDDGTCGMEAIQRSGGATIVQDPSEASYPDMPKNVLKHITVEYCVPIVEMGEVIVQLLTTPTNTQSIPNDIKIEAQIAERFATNIEVTQQLGEQVPISCPDCGGSLWKVSHTHIGRYRCHVGHIYTEDGLLRKQAEALEETLWVSLRMLEERQHLLKNMIDKDSSTGRQHAANLYRERLAEILKHINRMRDFLNSNEIYKGAED